MKKKNGKMPDSTINKLILFSLIAIVLCTVAIILIRVKKGNVVEKADEVAYYNELADTMASNYRIGEPMPEVTTEATEEEASTVSYQEQPRYVGTPDCLVRIDKINLERLVFTGEGRDYNLNRYLFVTGTPTMTYGEGNYVICGHSSTGYGHSFNRLKELAVGDDITIIKDNVEDHYTVSTVVVDAKSSSNEYTGQTLEQRVTLITCDKVTATPNYLIVQAIKNE